MSKKTDDFKTKKIYAILALKWCVENFGVNERKRSKLQFNLSPRKRKIKKDIVYGIYCFWRNKITIYLPNCDNNELIVSTVIHEYTHYLQSRTKYQVYEKTHYYSTNPYERQAQRKELKYTKMCLKDIKKIIR